MRTATLNQRLAAGRRRAFTLEQELAAIYARSFRDLGRHAADRFEALSTPAPMVAAGDDQPPTPGWVPPDVDELLNQPVFDAQSQERALRIHEQALELAIPRQVPGVVFDATSPFAAPLLASVGTKSVNLGLAARDVILKVIGDAYQQGLSVRDTAIELRSQIDHLSQTTALMQARTDLNALANGASLQSVEALEGDGPKFKQWLATFDARTRDTHVDANGQTVPTDQPFQVGDDLLMYPGDPSGSNEETINCRCTIIYTDELKEADMQDLTASVVIVTDDDATEATEAAAPTRWMAILAVEGEYTVDGRVLDPGGITWRPLPLTLMAMTVESETGHVGSQVAGRIDRIWREPMDDGTVLVMGEGIFDTDGEYGAEIARLVGDSTLRGVSVDLYPDEVVYRPRGAAPGEADIDRNDLEAILAADDTVVAFVTSTLLGATVCPFPAIGTAQIQVLETSEFVAAADRPPVLIRATFASSMRTWLDRNATAIVEPADDGLTASAAGMAPLEPPLDWFRDPKLTELTPLTITDDGRVFGHVAGWNLCHVGNPQGAGICTPPPRSKTAYSAFHLGELITAEGEAISVGQITIDGPHAPVGVGITAARAKKHYDDTSTVVAHVRCGEDRFGIWHAGAIAPDTTPEVVRRFRGSKLSGDWRKVNGRIDLIAAHCVNVPGYVIPRPMAHILASADDGEPLLALVAAGIVGEHNDPASVQAAIEAAAARMQGLDGLLAIFE